MFAQNSTRFFPLFAVNWFGYMLSLLTLAEGNGGQLSSLSQTPYSTLQLNNMNRALKPIIYPHSNKFIMIETGNVSPYIEKQLRIC